MTDYDIKIIRAAFREIQKLPHQYFEDVAHIVTEMAKGFLGDKKKLKGYKDLWRTKNNDARVIWTQERTTNEILIIKAGKRNDVYQGLIGDRHISNPLPLSHLLDIEEEKLYDIPTYQWSNFDTKSGLYII